MVCSKYEGLNLSILLCKSVDIDMITYTQRATEEFFPGSENKPSLLESNFEYQTC